MVGPVQAQAEGVTQQKKLDVYNEIIEATALGPKTQSKLSPELETLRDENPSLRLMFLLLSLRLLNRVITLLLVGLLRVS